jgi:predicted Zn finger-like uncharacterized protein
MIVSCPTCRARFRLNGDRHRGKRVTLKCVRCGHVFKAAFPLSPPDEPLRVMVAHSDQNLCAAVGTILKKERIPFHVSNDGHQALSCMEAAPPQVALIDVALPGLYAFEVVEKVRNRPGLRDVKIILLSSVYNSAAYKRSPSSLYGADDYIEKHHLSDHLLTKINRLTAIAPQPGRAEAAGGQRSGAEDADFIEKMNAVIAAAEKEEVSAGLDGLVIEKAKRLARIIVSDISLYNQERVDEGVRNGTFFDILGNEIEEGRRLFRERFTPEICRHEDFLQAAFESFVERRRRELGA